MPTLCSTSWKLLSLNIDEMQCLNTSFSWWTRKVPSYIYSFFSIPHLFIPSSSIYLELVLFQFLSLGLSSLPWSFIGFPGSSDGKVCPQCREPEFDPWDWKIPLEKEMATHSSILACKIPWTEEPGWLQFIGRQRVRQAWATMIFFFPFGLL